MMRVCLPAASIQTLEVVRLFYDSMLGADAPPDSQIAASMSSAAHGIHVLSRNSAGCVFNAPKLVLTVVDWGIPLRAEGYERCVRNAPYEAYLTR